MLVNLHYNYNYKDTGMPIMDICQRNVERNKLDIESHSEVIVRELNWHSPFSPGTYVHV